ncbi:MAG: rRNA maturation RNase YbeY [Clostridia bacterium]|nr:rRNA maturation RNase YbeY [Clostridia bacterium]
MKSIIEVSGKTALKLKWIAEFVALSVIKFMGQPDELEVAIEFVSEKEIQRLNREERNIDKVTDVLSFPSISLEPGDKLNVNSEECEFLKTDSGLIHFGDMAICIKRLREQAQDFGWTAELELKKLVIHSMLHLMGYDHIKDEDYEIMKSEEDKLDKLINIEVFNGI